MLVVAGDVGVAVQVFHGAQARGLGSGRHAQDTAELFRVHVVGPDVVVDVHAGVLTDKQGAHGLGVVHVVGVGDAVHLGDVALGIGRHGLAEQRGFHIGPGGDVGAVDHVALAVLDAAGEVEGVGRARLVLGEFHVVHRNAFFGLHAGLDPAHGVVHLLVRVVEGHALALGELGGGPQVGGVAARLEEGGGLLHAGLELEPDGLGAARAHGDITLVAGVAEAGQEDVAQGQALVLHGLDFGVGAVTEPDPADVGRAAVLVAGLVPLGGVDGAARPGIVLLVAHEHEQAAVRAVVAVESRAPVGGKAGDFPGAASHLVVLGHFVAAVGLDRHFHGVTVVVGIGLLLAAEVHLGHGLQARRGRGVALFAGDVVQVVVFLARQVGVPGGQATEAENPAAVDRAEVHAGLAAQAQLAAPVLVQRVDVHGHGHAAVPVLGLVGLHAVGQNAVVLPVVDQEGLAAHRHQAGAVGGFGHHGIAVAVLDGVHLGVEQLPGSVFLALHGVRHVGVLEQHVVGEREVAGRAVGIGDAGDGFRVGAQQLVIRLGRGGVREFHALDRLGAAQTHTGRAGSDAEHCRETHQDEARLSHFHVSHTRNRLSS